MAIVEKNGHGNAEIGQLIKWSSMYIFNQAEAP